MNIRRLSNEIMNDWQGAGFEVMEMESDFARLWASVVYRKLYGDRSFGINVYLYGSGALHVTINVGSVHVSKKGYLLDLVNTFNIDSAWFKAYVSEEDEDYQCFVELHFATFESLTHEPNEKIVSDYASFAIGRLLEENMEEMLRDILDYLDE